MNVIKYLFLFLTSSITCFCQDTINLKQSNRAHITGKFKGFDTNISTTKAFLIDSSGYYKGNFRDSIFALKTVNAIPEVLRFPGGDVANRYHRCRKGYGYRLDEFPVLLQSTCDDPLNENSGYYPITKTNPFDPCISTVPLCDTCIYLNKNINNYKTMIDSAKKGIVMTKYSNYVNLVGADSNIIYPFISFAKQLGMIDNKNLTPHVNYVLNLYQHFKYRSGLRDQLFQNIKIIDTIKSLEALKNNSDLNTAFKAAIFENLIGIETFLKNDIFVSWIELGNEFNGNQYCNLGALSLKFDMPSSKLSKDDRRLLAQSVWAINRDTTLKYYVSICKLYKRLILDMYNKNYQNIAKPKFAAVGEQRKGNLFSIYRDYIKNHLNSEIDGYVIHNYNSVECNILNDTVGMFLDLELNTTLNEMKILADSTNKKIIFSEWNYKYPETCKADSLHKYTKTFFEAWYYFNHLRSEISLLNKNSKSAIDLSCSVYYASNSDGFNILQLLNSQNNFKILKKPAFYAYSLFDAFYFSTDSMFALKTQPKNLFINNTNLDTVQYSVFIKNNVIHIYFSNFNRSLASKTEIIKFDVSKINSNYNLDKKLAKMRYYKSTNGAFSALDTNLYNKFLNLNNPDTIPKFSIGLITIPLLPNPKTSINNSLARIQKSEPFIININPNPATNNHIQIDIYGSATMAKLLVYDINGKLMDYKDQLAYSNNFDISNFQSGNYFFQIIIDKQKITKLVSIIK